MLRTHRINPLDLLVRQVAIAAIKTYQRYISPHKGFACPHRVLYGSESCSGYIKGAIAQQGLLQATSIARERFKACKTASLILRSQQSESEKQNRQRWDAHCLNNPSMCCDGCASCIPLSDCSLPDCGYLDAISCCGFGAFLPFTPRLLRYKRYNKNPQL
ncbi:MAG TPA: membrane protein insertion efficiency factor YidD [Cyanobacteria bacterium UBA11372]|nr:membrane protein insertion efficiency factor YidD [Cyanobacteria bacterium UBA11372]